VSFACVDNSHNHIACVAVNDKMHTRMKKKDDGRHFFNGKKSDGASSFMGLIASVSRIKTRSKSIMICFTRADRMYHSDQPIRSYVIRYDPYVILNVSLCSKFPRASLSYMCDVVTCMKHKGRPII